MAATIEGPDGAGELWVFAYGSLLWDPCFTVAEARPARLSGWRRSFCMWSIHYRGTPSAPGLVLALDAAEKAACEGIAYRVPQAAAAAALDTLRQRELVSSAYREAWLPVMLEDARQVQAVVYVVDPDHAQYAAGLSPAEQAAIIARAAGERGPNRDYLANTCRHLQEIGLHDPELAALAEAVASL